MVASLPLENWIVMNYAWLSLSRSSVLPSHKAYSLLHREQLGSHSPSHRKNKRKLRGPHVYWVSLAELPIIFFLRVLCNVLTIFNILSSRISSIVWYFWHELLARENTYAVSVLLTCNRKKERDTCLVLHKAKVKDLYSRKCLKIYVSSCFFFSCILLPNKPVLKIKYPSSLF